MTLEGLGLLSRERLLIVILAGSTDTVEEDATGSGVPEEVDDEEMMAMKMRSQRTRGGR